MLAEIITIGDELLLGQVINTNSSWIGNRISALGIKVQRITTVGDNREEILKILSESQQRSQFVFISGGLGPTSDDITKPVLCEYFNTTLVFNESVYENALSVLSKRGAVMNELNRNQALVPASAKIVENDIGTAPGLWMVKDNVNFIALPGVPFEMESIINNRIVPAIKEKFKLQFNYHKTVLTTGIGESKLAIQISDWENKLPDSIKLAYLPSPGMVKLRLSGYGHTIIKNIVEKEIIKLEAILGNAIFGYDNDTLETIVGRNLAANHQTLSTAESCTGGNIARMITSVPGSSEYFLGSIIAYSNDIKSEFLEVSKEFIQQYGAVSQQVAESMSKGIMKKFNSDYSIGVTGIAGPSGGTADKPVGTTWIAVSSGHQTISEKFLFGDNRERNIIRSSFAALNMLRKMLISN